MSGAYSYAPGFTCILRDFRVGLPGLEPGTSSLSVRSRVSCCALPCLKFRAYRGFLGFLAPQLFCSVRVFSTLVAVRLQYSTRSASCLCQRCTETFAQKWHGTQYSISVRPA